ncbi:hypothetical protein AHAS_Ahas07G0041700 [Arachis hypogaea]
MDSREMRSSQICRLCGKKDRSQSRCPQHVEPSGVGGHLTYSNDNNGATVSHTSRCPCNSSDMINPSYDR